MTGTATGLPVQLARSAAADPAGMHRACKNRNKKNVNSHTLQQLLGVCGTCLISPGWLVLGVPVGTCDVQTL